MKRKNDFAGLMGKKYEQVIKIICPHAEELNRYLIGEIEKDVKLAVQETGKKKFSLLDLGCGDGKFLANVRTHIGFEGYNGQAIFPFGVDSSPIMVERARQRLGVGLFENREPVVKSEIGKYLEAMNLIGQKVDFISANFTMHNFSKKERTEIFNSIYGALLNRGIFYMQDIIARDSPVEHARDYSGKLKLVESLAENGLPELVEPWKQHCRYDNSPQRRMVEKELKYDLKMAGFRKVEVKYRKNMEAIVVARK